MGRAVTRPSLKRFHQLGVHIDGTTRCACLLFLHAVLMYCAVSCCAVFRPTLKRFHQLVVHIDGTVSTTGKGWWTEVLDQKLLNTSSSAALAAISAAGGQRP